MLRNSRGALDTNANRYVTIPGCYVCKACVQGPNLKLIHMARLIPVLTCFVSGQTF